MGRLGLFHRAILQSGSALCPWALARGAVGAARELAHSLGCPSQNNIATVECLRQRPAVEIVRASTRYGPFGPTIDGLVVQAEPALLMTNMSELYGSYGVMFGVARAEGFLSAWPSGNVDPTRRGIETDRRDAMLRDAVTKLYGPNVPPADIAALAAHEYTDWTRPPHPVATFEATVEALGDALIVAPVMRAAHFHALAPAAAPRYLYVFAYQTEHGDFPQKLGCVHGEELPYIFGAPLIGHLGPFKANYTRSENALSETVMTYWTNFAKTG
ncbi:Ces3 [Cordylochernes scorpioides]|uniref:Ces3 n=1 Tax=Cordylochernes scorpioides TaxID=51811 RepID=A0ABY6LP53_9ARAC|nr:Ces3 [Cordylochernes scorpioides]